MPNCQEFACENQIKRLTHRLCLSLALLLVCPHASPAGQSPANTLAVDDDIVLQDVQDHIDTIDQAGLYVLLSRLGASDTASQPPTFSPNPMDVYNFPNRFRGKVLQYDIILHPLLEPVHLSRNHQFNSLLYATAKIPFDQNRQMPAIILLTAQPETFPVDRATVTGYFYMILRQATRKPPEDAGPATLDYLVLLATDLTPVVAKPSTHIIYRWTTMRLSILGIVLLLAIWIILRRRAAGARTRSPVTRRRL